MEVLLSSNNAKNIKELSRLENFLSWSNFFALINFAFKNPTGNIYGAFFLFVSAIVSNSSSNFSTLFVNYG